MCNPVPTALCFGICTGHHVDTYGGNFFHPMMSDFQKRQGSFYLVLMPWEVKDSMKSN